MGLFKLFVLQCVLFVANTISETTIPPPDSSSPSDVIQDQDSSNSSASVYNSNTLCNSSTDFGSRFVLHQEFKAWFEAMAACSREGAQLAVPRSPQEAAALGARLLQVADPIPHFDDVMPDALFVGIHNIAGDSNWRTLDGALLSEAGYDLWLEGGVGECGALLGDGRYVRQPCRTRMRFACERPRGAQPPARRQAAGYVEVGDAGRFRLYEEPLAWALALRRCESEGASLAVPASAREAGLLAGALFTRAAANARLQHQGFFVGVTDVAQEGVWRTVDGRSLDAAGYSTWKTGQPSGNRRENCGVLLKDGRYAEHTCTYPMAYCCQENIGHTVSEDLVVTRGRYKLHQKPLPWFEALRACQRENGTLVSANTQERDFLKNMMRGERLDHYGSPVVKITWMHVAIYDTFGNQTWRYINEEESQPSMVNENYTLRGRNYQRNYPGYVPHDSSYENYNDYGSDSPNVNYQVSNGRCVKMEYDGTIANHPCYEQLPYVCFV